MMTGDERYLSAAEAGTAYLREHFRATDSSHDICYWYHAIDVKGKKERKILASRFGDDWDAIPAYEQIYALAGPVQTYRITGDPLILEDARRTQAMFNRFYDDPKLGGYFSHVDPIGFDPRAEVLTYDRARKNWNSVGDHAPAYLINLYLATGAQQDADMLDLLCRHDCGAFSRLREQRLRAGEVPRRLESGPHLGLAAEPRRRRPQPEDRLEPDAYRGAKERRALQRNCCQDCWSNAGASVWIRSAAVGTT